MKALAFLLFLPLLTTACLTAEQAAASFTERIEASNHCESDEDCTLIHPGCPLGCAVAVHVEHAKEAEEYAAELIATYERGGQSCAYDCIATGPAYCDGDGRCRVDPLEP